MEWTQSLLNIWAIYAFWSIIDMLGKDINAMNEKWRGYSHNINEKLDQHMQRIDTLKESMDAINERLYRDMGDMDKKWDENMQLTRTYISQFETISAKNLKKIAETFGEPLDPLLIAYGYLPDYTKEARQKDSETMNKGLIKLTKKIMEKDV